LAQERIDHFPIATMDNSQLEIGDGQHTTVFYLWDVQSEISEKEVTHLNELVDDYTNDDVIFIAATADKCEEVDAFLEKSEFKYIQVCGKEGKKIMKLFNNNGLVRTFPKHFIVDENGVIAKSAIGSCTTIHSLLEAELSEKEVKD
jgi:peroxiredoxin